MRETVIFDGRAEAFKRELWLREKVSGLGFAPRILSVVFEEDEASQLYAKLKFQAALRVGMEFDRVNMSIHDEVELIAKRIRSACARGDVHGVMVQKPGKAIWQQAASDKPQDFVLWWQQVTGAICPEKDIDCLTRQNLEKVYGGDWTVLPATVKAVLGILERALGMDTGQLTRNNLDTNPGENNTFQMLNDKHKKVLVIGRSEIVGRPLEAVLEQKGFEVEIVGSNTENLEELVRDHRMLVSATGVAGLVKGEWVREGAIVIDVSSPRGDVEFETAKEKAAFITPVPGGVGPVTVVSLLENVLKLV